ncbi:hypothetical protein D3C84_1268590 [compost metagenome]
MTKFAFLVCVVESLFTDPLLLVSLVVAAWLGDSVVGSNSEAYSNDRERSCWEPVDIQDFLILLPSLSSR